MDFFSNRESDLSLFLFPVVKIPVALVLLRDPARPSPTRRTRQRTARHSPPGVIPFCSFFPSRQESRSGLWAWSESLGMAQA